MTLGALSDIPKDLLRGLLSPVLLNDWRHAFDYSRCLLCACNISIFRYIGSPNDYTLVQFVTDSVGRCCADNFIEWTLLAKLVLILSQGNITRACLVYDPVGGDLLIQNVFCHRVGYMFLSAISC
jgi:hypothetical protein